MQGTVDSTVSDQAHPVATNKNTSYESMGKSIRSWSWLLVIWAIANSVLFQNHSWSVVLIVIALMSFYFYDVAAMFLIYTMMFVWVGTSNLLLTGDPTWMVTGVIQFVFAVSAYRTFRKYHNAKAEHKSQPFLDQTLLAKPSSDRETVLPWLALSLGLFSLVGLFSDITASTTLSGLSSPSVEEMVWQIVYIMYELGILGIPIGIAALATGSRPKAASITGMILGFLAVLCVTIIIVSAAIESDSLTRVISVLPG